MKPKFDLSQISTMMQLNLVSIVIIGFCEVFAIAVFITKGFSEGVERWKFMVYVAIVAVITLLLLASILLFIYFLRMKRKENK